MIVTTIRRYQLRFSVLDARVSVPTEARCTKSNTSSGDKTGPDQASIRFKTAMRKTDASDRLVVKISMTV